jgi:hypothetical protein
METFKSQEKGDIQFLEFYLSRCFRNFGSPKKKKEPMQASIGVIDKKKVAIIFNVSFDAFCLSSISIFSFPLQ